jgi:hypothetical protein
MVEYLIARWSFLSDSIMHIPIAIIQNRFKATQA